MVVLEISNNGDSIQKVFYLEKPGTGHPTSFAKACSQAHVDDVVLFNGLKYKILRFIMMLSISNIDKFYIEFWHSGKKYLFLL